MGGSGRAKQASRSWQRAPGVGILLLPHAVVLPPSGQDLGQLVHPKKPSHLPPQPCAQ